MRLVRSSIIVQQSMRDSARDSILSVESKENLNF